MKHDSVSPLLAGLLFAFCVGLAGSAAADDASPNPSGFYVGNWNVENLYDTVDDPDLEGDDEFLPNNPTTRWDRVRYETKLDNLAQVISGMNKGRGPDILGIEEVENEEVIRDLVDKLEGKSYGIVHADSPDPRGIDTALIFNRTHFSLLETHAYKVALKWDHTTRDILHAVFEDRDEQRLHVFVNHWPSRGGGIATSEPNRFEAARTLALATDRLFRREPNARVVILGDFNDEPSNRSIRDVLDVEPYPSRSGTYVATNLYNLSAPKSDKGQGSFSHSFDGETEWRMYDQIIVSGALLESADIEPDQDLFWIDKPTYMTEEHGQDKGAPVPTFENQEDYQGGYSDHFPVGARFVDLAETDKAPAEKPAIPAAVANTPLHAAAQAEPKASEAQKAEPAEAPLKKAATPIVAPSRPEKVAPYEPVIW